ncbi:MAG: DUF4238 domain-containing protein [Elusimicrobiota bacterium]|jgi:hypothetical protein
MAQGVPRRHHYVPQFYLEYFATRRKGGEPGFWVYDRGGSPPREATPLGTAAKRDLYTFFTPTGEKDTSLETQLFSRVEGWTKPILDKWIQHPGVRLTKSDVEMVALFIALQYIRVPRTINAGKEAEEKFVLEWWKLMGRQPAEVEKMWDQFGKKSAAWASIDEFREQIQNFNKYFKLEGDQKQALLMSLQQVQEIHEHIMKLVPQILISPSGNFYATSDAPVNVFVPTGNKTALFGAGFGLEKVEIVFPFSPSLALFFSRQGIPGWFKIRGNAVIEYNRRCVAYAERFVISPYESHRIARFIEEFSDRYGKPRVNTEETIRTVEKLFASKEAE